MVHFSISLCQNRLESLHCGYVYTETYLFYSKLGLPHPVGNIFIFFLMHSKLPSNSSSQNITRFFNSVKNARISLNNCLITGNVPRPQILWHLELEYYSEATTTSFGEEKKAEISAARVLQRRIMPPVFN